MSETKFGSFDDLMPTTALELQPVASRLRLIVLELDPDAVEVVRLGDGAATYGLGPRKMSEGYLHFLPYKNWVTPGSYWASTWKIRRILWKEPGRKCGMESEND